MIISNNSTTPARALSTGKSTECVSVTHGTNSIKKYNTTSDVDLSDFRAFLITNNKSPATVRAYLYELGVFFRDGYDLTVDAVRQFMNGRAEMVAANQITACSYNKYVHAFKAAGVCYGVDCSFLHKMREVVPEFERLTKDEADAMIDVDPPPSFWGMYLLMMKNCGTRTSEIRCLKWSDIRNDFAILWKDKTGHQRKFSIGNATLERLSEYRKSCTTEYLFESTHRPGFPVSEAACMKEFRRRLELLGIKKVTRLHDFRHAYIDRQARTHPLKWVQQQVGHRSIVTTSRYLHPTDDDLRALQESDPWDSSTLAKRRKLELLAERAKELGILNDDAYIWKIQADGLHIDLKSEK